MSAKRTKRRAATRAAKRKPAAKRRPSAKREPTAKRKPKAKAGMQQAAAKIKRLVRQAQALGAINGLVMPIDEIELGVKLSKQPRAAVIPSLLVLSADTNMHARRVALSALRRLEAWDDARAFDVFLRGLADPEGWVRYDAAWALGDSGTRDPRALSALEELARAAAPDPDLSDGDARAATQAAESLASLRHS